MRWIVRPGDGATVGRVLEHAGADAHAVPEGRVFVGVRRVRRRDEAVQSGDEITIARPLDTSAAVTILLETRDLVAVDKPAGVPTIADHAGAAHSLVALAARAIGTDVARLHATSRLDREVSGVVVFALTKGAADRLLRARAEGRYARRYVAIASRTPGVDRGTWDGPIGRAKSPRLRAVGGRDPVAAETRFAVCARASGGPSLLSLAPRTGRTHQLRLHAAHAGAPLVGDRAYGGPARLTLSSGRVIEANRIALHAARVAIPDERGALLAVTAVVPAELRDWWSALGGEPAAWEVASSCALD